MKRYQWKVAKLKKKSQLYDWLMFFLAAIALVVWKWLAFLPEFVLLVLLGGAVVCFVLSGRVKSQDARLKPKSS